MDVLWKRIYKCIDQFYKEDKKDTFVILVYDITSVFLQVMAQRN
jgi:hypothetical protein